MTGMVGTPDGKNLLKETCTGTEPEALGLELAERLIRRGADAILEELKG